MKHEMNILGIDIAKRVFHAVGMDDRGKIVYRKRLSRHDLLPFIAKLPPVLIGSRTYSLRIMFRDLSHTAWVGGISQSYTLPTSFQSPCPPLCPSLYAHPSRSIPRSSTGILC
jgi:hypothetical protein